MTLSPPRPTEPAEPQAGEPRAVERRAVADLWREARVPALAFVAHAALVAATAALAVAAFAQQRPIKAAGVYAIPPTTGLSHYLVDPLRNWDGFWYTWIADRGYHDHPAIAAFWPLYPLLMRLVHALTGWSLPLAGVVVSNVAFLGALVLLYRLVRLDYGEAVAGRTVWLLALFPTAYYFSAVYTESLFLLLTVAAVYLGRTERRGRAAVAACLATLTHDTGVLVLIPLGLFLVRRWGWDPRRWWRQALPLLAVPLAPLPFLWYLDRLWGDPLLPLHAHHERIWSRAWAPPWTTLARAVEKVDLSWLGALAASPDWHTLASPDLRQRFAVSRSYELVVALALAPLLAYALARLRPAYSLYALARYALPLVIPSAYNPLMSTPRLVVVVFPLFIALALLLRRRWLFGVVLALFALQLVGLLIQFSTWFWVA